MERTRFMEIVEGYWLSDEVLPEYFKLLLARMTHDDREPMFDPNFAIAFVAGLIYAKLRNDEHVSSDEYAHAANVVEEVMKRLMLTPYIDTRAAN